MKATLLAETLRKCGHVMPHWIWGPPGIGKSQVVQQWALDEDLELRDLRACLLESVDIRGLPKITDDCAKWLPPEFLPRDPKSKGILFLDELAQAPIPTQNALLQLSLDRKVGEHYKLPDGWHIVAASNRLEDGAGVSRVTTALSARFCHLEMETESSEWLVWAAEKGVNPEVRSFVAFRPGLLHKFDRKEKSSPNPRAWEFVSKLMAANPPSAAELSVISGVVGHGAAGEFAAFRRVYSKLPDMDKLLYEDAKIPDDPSTKYAIIGASTDYLRRHMVDPKSTAKLKEKVQGAVSGLLIRLGAEFATAGFRQAAAIDKTLFDVCQKARDFAAKNRHLFF